MMKPTVGIEVELPWPTMLERVDVEAATILRESHGFWGLPLAQQKRVQQGFDSLDTVYKEEIQQIFNQQPIRPGNDGFAELAFEPFTDTRDLLEVLRKLYDQELLLEGETYPLHVTFGGISARQRAWVALMAMEICEGVEPERLIQTKTWARKGNAGILERKPGELEIDKQGVEFRTLQLLGIQQFERIVNLGQTVCGAIIDDERELVRGVQTIMVEALAEQAIDASKRWPNPQHEIEPWNAMSNALANEQWRSQLTDEILAII